MSDFRERWHWGGVSLVLWGEFRGKKISTGRISQKSKEHNIHGKRGGHNRTSSKGVPKHPAQITISTGVLRHKRKFCLRKKGRTCSEGASVTETCYCGRTGEGGSGKSHQPYNKTDILPGGKKKNIFIKLPKQNERQVIIIIIKKTQQKAKKK